MQALLDLFRFQDPIARGLATAGSAHGLGTAALARKYATFPSRSLIVNAVVLLIMQFGFICLLALASCMAQAPQVWYTPDAKCLLICFLFCLPASRRRFHSARLRTRSSASSPRCWCPSRPLLGY